MDKAIDSIIAFLEKLRKMDKAKFAKELSDLTYYINRQLFLQIPSVSAISGIVVGSWIASTFTTSPFKAFLSKWGVMKGGTHVVSSTTYKFLSVFFPLIATAVTAYLVQKGMKNYREKRLAKDMAYVAQLGKEVQSELQDKMNILDKAKAAGLVSESEYHTKKAALYQTYSRPSTSKIEEFLINKMSS